MSRITHFKADSVLRLEFVEFEPGNGVVTIGGANGEGKSSVLDSLMMVLGGKRNTPEQPVHGTKRRARIEIAIDSDPPLKAIRTITARGTDTIEVLAADGTKMPSPQSILNTLWNSLTLDPLEFVRKKPKEQTEILRQLVGLDTAALDAERKVFYDEAAVVRASLGRVKDKVENHEDAYSEDAGAGVELVSLADLLAKREEARKDAQAVRVVQEEQNLQRVKIEEIQIYISNTELKIAALKEEVESDKGRLGEAKAALDVATSVLESADPAPDTEAIETEIAEAESTNNVVRRNIALEGLREEQDTLTDFLAVLKGSMDDIDEVKIQLISKAEWPVKGLGINEDFVTYNDMPFSQASGAERLRISVAIGIHLNPDLRVLLVRDGSLLDDESLELLHTLAEEQDCQVFLERVGDGDECSIVMEDGRIREEAEEVS